MKKSKVPMPFYDLDKIEVILYDYHVEHKDW